ncbi:MAG TPA: hypothetical protein VF064_09220 [Pyrinomonadaceae bacterium]
MPASKLVLFCALAVTAHATAPSVPGQGPGARCTRYKGGSVKQKSSKPREARTSHDLDKLVEALKAQGLGVERAGDVSQPFFSVESRALTVNGENVQVFQYRTAEAAAKEASQVSPDGSGVGTSMASWVGTPHFFRGGRLIALYVGDDAKVLEALRASLGAQFAGG